MSDVSIHCPHCRRFTALSVAMANFTANYREYRVPCIWNSSRSHEWWIGICNFCKNPVLAMDNGQKIYPQELPKPSDERISKDVRVDFDEAKVCLASGAYRGTVVLARRTLQTACVEKGANTNEKLYQQIDWLFKEGIITKDVKEWAHAVRWIGNDAAHPDKQIVSKKDAEEILNLSEQILNILYVAPAIAKTYQKLVKEKI